MINGTVIFVPSNINMFFSCRYLENIYNSMTIRSQMDKKIIRTYLNIKVGIG